MKNPNADNIIVHMSSNKDLMQLCTFSRHHRIKTFYLWTTEIEDALRSGGFKYTSDCGNFCRMFCFDEPKMGFTITWLSRLGNGKIEGFEESFEIPVEQLRSVLDGNKERVLCKPVTREIPIHTRNAGRSIRKALENKLTRRALSKALRDNFKYTDGEVTLYNDWAGFYFKASGRMPICGGLIAHTVSRRTKVGIVQEIRYSVHT